LNDYCLKLVIDSIIAKAAFSPEIIAAFNEPLSCSSPAKKF